MAILVTGAAGLIGHQICQLLAPMGRPVVGYDRTIPPDAVDGVSYVRGDLLDHVKLYGTIKTHGIEAIAHAGAISGPMVEADNPFVTCQTNIMGTLNVFEAARLFGVRRVVYCGSTSSFGPTPEDEPMKDDMPLRPGDVYGATKAACDLLSWTYHAQHGLDVIVLRFTSVYGPRRVQACLLRQMITDAIAGRATVLAHGASHGIEYVHAADCALGVICAIDASRPPAYRAYNISSGEWYRLADVAAIVRDVLPEARITIGPGPLPGATSQGVATIALAQAELGFTPKYSLRRGIIEYANWLQSHPY